MMRVERHPQLDADVDEALAYTFREYGVAQVSVYADLIVEGLRTVRERDCSISRRHRSSLVTESVVNLMGPALLSYALRSGSGTLVNVTSSLAYAPSHDAVYSASKSALTSFSRALRHAAACSGVRFVEVIPPVVATELSGERTVGSDGAVAEAIVEGLANGQTRIIVGAERFTPWLGRLGLTF